MKSFFPAILTAAVLSVCSCTSHSALELALKSAGPNRAELESVLSHYRSTDNNPDKLRAAEFLLENMPYHYSYSGDRIHEYYDYAASILSDKDLTPEQQRDSLVAITDTKYSDLPNCTVSDAQIITADFLIDNIDKSFLLWTTCPWASQITFEEYLEWLLPYKGVELQELDHWRDTLSAHFGDGLKNPIKNDVEYNTAMGLADTIRKETSIKMKRYGLYSCAGLPLLSDYLLPRQTFGDIPDYSLIAVLIMRSLGIPAVLDETPVGSRFTAATKWYVIMSDNGTEKTSEWDISTIIGASFFPYERGPKVFRNSYAVNKERLEYKQKSKLQYPFELNKKDVTSQYFLTSDIAIPISISKRKQLAEKYVYVASSVRDDDNPWHVIDFGEINNGKACFHDMGREVLYQIMGFNGNELIPISDPFILHKDCSIEYVSSDTINSSCLDKWKNNAL